MKIKVCGNRDARQIREMDAMGVDYAGLIFYDASPRAVTAEMKPAMLDGVALKKVGVFVNETIEHILDKVQEYALDVVQLHGDETPAFCDQLSGHVKVIKAFRIQDGQTDIDWMVKDYYDVCDLYLFDKGSKGLYGGTGEKFDWSVLQHAEIGKRFFLSGGISVDDVEMLKSFVHPYFYGIDINTRFEVAPGNKDIELLKKFVNLVRTDLK